MRKFYSVTLSSTEKESTRQKPHPLGGGWRGLSRLLVPRLLVY
jgi:hypothetical protein